MTDRKLLMEVCCGSADDAVEAYLGGAGRAELNSALFHGGLTPSLGALIEAKKRVTIPIMCMVRPREGGFCYSDAEYQTMLTDARLFAEHGADGIVFGFLRPDGTIDADRCRALLAVIGGRESVFHRAIDVVPDVFAALDTLVELGVTRVLTSGQAPNVPEGAQLLKRMIEYADGRIAILPGGGINPRNAAWCVETLNVRELHASAHKLAFDTSASGNPAIHFGGSVYPPEDRYRIADAEKVAQFVGTMAQTTGS